MNYRIFLLFFAIFLLEKGNCGIEDPINPQEVSISFTEVRQPQSKLRFLYDVGQGETPTMHLSVLWGALVQSVGVLGTGKTYPFKKHTKFTWGEDQVYTKIKPEEPILTKELFLDNPMATYIDKSGKKNLIRKEEIFRCTEVKPPEVINIVSFLATEAIQGKVFVDMLRETGSGTYFSYSCTPFYILQVLDDGYQRFSININYKFNFSQKNQGAPESILPIPLTQLSYTHPHLLQIPEQKQLEAFVVTQQCGTKGIDSQEQYMDDSTPFSMSLTEQKDKTLKTRIDFKEKYILNIPQRNSITLNIPSPQTTVTLAKTLDHVICLDEIKYWELPKKHIQNGEVTYPSQEYECHQEDIFKAETSDISDTPLSTFFSHGFPSAKGTLEHRQLEGTVYPLPTTKGFVFCVKQSGTTIEVTHQPLPDSSDKVSRQLNLKNPSQRNIEINVVSWRSFQGIQEDDAELNIKRDDVTGRYGFMIELSPGETRTLSLQPKRSKTQ